MPLQNWQETEVTIAAGAAVSDAVNVDGPVLAVITPDEWTAADIGFEGWVTGTTYAPVKTQAGAVLKITNVTTDAAGIYHVPLASAVPVAKSLKLTSLNTSTGAAVNQAAARTLKIRFAENIS